VSVTIRPGYDFKITETPTRDKLLRQALGLSVSGIDSTYLDSTLLGHDFSSASTPTLSEGWMWTDGGGNTWIETDNGPVRWFRSQGGWETNRYQWRHADTAPGSKVVRGGGSGSDPYHADDTVGMNTGPAPIGVLEDQTAASGDYTRVVGRGIAPFFIGVTDDWFMEKVTLIRTTSTPAVNWSAPIDYSSAYERAAALTLSNALSIGKGWYYGKALWGPGSTF